MNAESFEEIITRCPHLSEQQKDDLNSNSKYLSSEERQSLIDGLVHADQELKSIDEREQQSPEELNAELSQLLTTFEKEEVPKLIKEAESKEHDSAAEEAENLLNTME